MLARIAHWQSALLEPPGAHGGSYLAALGMFHGEEEEEEEEGEEEEAEGGGEQQAAGAAAMEVAAAAATATGGQDGVLDDLELYPGVGSPKAGMDALRLPERKSFHIILHRALAFLVREAVKNPLLVQGPGGGELERLLGHMRGQPRLALGVLEVRRPPSMSRVYCVASSPHGYTDTPFPIPSITHSCP